MSGKMEELIKSYKIRQYEYLTEKKYLYFIFGNRKNINNLIIIAAKAVPILNDYVFIRKIEDQDDFLKNIPYIPVETFRSLDNKEWFLNLFFSITPKQRKKLLEIKYRILNSFDFNTYYIDFIEKSGYQNIKEFNIYFKDSFSISFWKADKIPLEKIQKSLIKIFSHSDTFLFWHVFFKSRKNQIKNVNFSPYLSKFLIEEFGSEPNKINSFFTIIPHLKSQYIDIPPNIFDEEFQYSLTLPINLKKMIEVFCIPGFTKEKYGTHTLYLIKALSRYYELEFYELNYKNKQLGNIHVSFYHNNSQFEINIVKNTIIEYFSHLKTNYDKINNEEQILKWLEYIDLKKRMIKNQQHTIIRNKI
jgi:hypothetical protein